MRNQKFRMEFVVHYHEVNPEEQATPLTMLYYLEDAAIAHSESYGSSIRSKCQIEGMDSLHPVCRHVILSEDAGQELAIAKTVWVRR